MATITSHSVHPMIRSVLIVNESGFRTHHLCPDEGEWFSAVRASESQALADAVNHEYACRHRSIHSPDSGVAWS